MATASAMGSALAAKYDVCKRTLYDGLQPADEKDAASQAKINTLLQALSIRSKFAAAYSRTQSAEHESIAASGKPP